MRETWVRSLGWEDPLEQGTGYTLQYSGVENSMDYIIHGVSKSWTQLNNFHSHFFNTSSTLNPEQSLRIPQYPSLHCLSHHPQFPVSIKEIRSLRFQRDFKIQSCLLPHSSLEQSYPAPPHIQRCSALHPDNLLASLPCSSLCPFPYLAGFQSLSWKCHLFFQTFTHSLLSSPTPNEPSCFSQSSHNTIRITSTTLVTSYYKWTHIIFLNYIIHF